MKKHEIYETAYGLAIMHATDVLKRVASDIEKRANSLEKIGTPASKAAARELRIRVECIAARLDTYEKAANVDMWSIEETYKSMRKGGKYSMSYYKE